VGYWGPQSKKKVDFAFATQREHGRPDAAAIATADENWVTMHGPKREMRRKKGEDLAAAAIAAMTAGERGAFVSACGGGTEQLDDIEAARH
jgi:anaerobic magnesium-protoporphyrin IX monomethyl ester cyclase